ncbi:MAG: TIGR02147 family protein [Chitinispirillaceae bacterium]|nr:TIGR02147 family protein [Chitinispirillaceae bacterium]
MKSVFEYLDYRSFLKDFYEQQKERHGYFSYRYFGKRVGIDPSYLLKVILKSRHLSEKSISGVCDFCGLTDKEAEYFHTLVHFAKARSQRESKLLFEKLLSVRYAKSHRLLERQYEYFRTWYHPVVRSVLEYFDFKGDFALLGKQLYPQISAKEARESVRLLIELNLIKKDTSGRYRLTETAVTTGEEWRSVAIAAYQEETIRLSHEAIERHDRSSRDVSTVTMNIGAADFEEIRERITEFRRSIISFVNESTDPDRTYQFNIQLFPLAGGQGRGG